MDLAFFGDANSTGDSAFIPEAVEVRHQPVADFERGDRIDVDRGAAFESGRAATRAALQPP